MLCVCYLCHSILQEVLLDVPYHHSSLQAAKGERHALTNATAATRDQDHLARKVCGQTQVVPELGNHFVHDRQQQRMAPIAFHPEAGIM